MKVPVRPSHIDRSPVLRHLLERGVVAVVRMDVDVPLVPVARAVAAGGVGAFEVTMTTPGALESLRALRAAAMPDCVIGAGTVLDADGAAEAVGAGAQFVVSPTLEPDVIAWCVNHDIPCLPGAMTPTEALEAWRLGASLVKIYPAPSVGPVFFQNILLPLPFLRLIPSGGMKLELVPEWIRAGAAAISVTSALLDPELIAREAWAELTARARRWTGAVAEARTG